MEIAVDLVERKKEKQAQGDREERLRGDVDLIVRGLHERRFKILKKFDVNFIGRGREARYILESVAGIEPSMGMGILYGPKGCGKSTLFRSMLASIQRSREEIETPFEAMIVSYEREEVREAEKRVEKLMNISFSEGLKSVAKEAFRDVLRGDLVSLLEGGFQGL